MSSTGTAGGADQPSAHGAPGIVLFARAEPALEALLGTGACACAVLDLADLPADDAAERIANCRAASMDAATALLSLDDPDAAKALALDGVHLTDPEHSIRAARERLGRSANIGAGPANSRHAAMLLGERDPDYVLLGATDGETWASPDRDLVTWWADLFEVPSVGFAANPEQALEMATAGADFVALGTDFLARPDADEQLTDLAAKLAELMIAEGAEQ